MLKFDCEGVFEKNTVESVEVLSCCETSRVTHMKYLRKKGSCNYQLPIYLIYLCAQFVLKPVWVEFHQSITASSTFSG